MQDPAGFLQDALALFEREVLEEVQCEHGADAAALQGQGIGRGSDQGCDGVPPVLSEFGILVEGPFRRGVDLAAELPVPGAKSQETIVLFHPRLQILADGLPNGGAGRVVSKADFMIALLNFGYHSAPRLAGLYT